jgi:hypothetical protein
LAHSLRGYLLNFVINRELPMKFEDVSLAEDAPKERRHNADRIYLGANQASE